MRTYDVLLNSGDTASGVLTTRKQAERAIATMRANLTCHEYFPVSLVKYRSASNQTIVESTVYSFDQE
jgi:hypothetical protein